MLLEQLPLAGGSVRVAQRLDLCRLFLGRRAEVVTLLVLEAVVRLLARVVAALAIVLLCRDLRVAAAVVYHN